MQNASFAVLCMSRNSAVFLTHHTHGLDATQAMEIDERNKMLAAVLAVERGNAYLRLKQFDLALEDCNAAIENDGSITAPLVTRSMCHTVCPVCWRHVVRMRCRCIVRPCTGVAPYMTVGRAVISRQS